MSNLQILPCPTCHGSKQMWIDWSPENGPIKAPCTVCNESGYHPDTIDKLARILSNKRIPGQWENWQKEWKEAYRRDVVAILDALPLTSTDLVV